MDTLGSVTSDADLVTLRRAVDVVNGDTRSALRALRILLRTLDETEDDASEVHDHSHDHGDHEHSHAAAPVTQVRGGARADARRARRSQPAGEAPVVRAIAKYVRTTPRKARLIADLVRG